MLLAEEVREYDQAEENEELQKQIHEAAYNKCYKIAKKELEKPSEVMPLMN